jgi:copper chaperone
MADTREITLSVPDVSCEHCVHTVNGTLSQLAGVQQVSTDIPSKTVHVRYDPGQVSLDQIAAALDEEGYPVVKA